MSRKIETEALVQAPECEGIRARLSALKTRLANKFAVGVSGDLVKSLRAGSFCRPPRRLSCELLDKKLELEACVSTSSGEGAESSSEDLEARNESPGLGPDMGFLASAYCKQIMDYSLEFQDFLRMTGVAPATQKATSAELRQLLCLMAGNEAHFARVSPELMTLVVVLAASEAALLSREVVLAFCSPQPSCRQAAVNKLLGLKKTKAYLQLKRLAR